MSEPFHALLRRGFPIQYPMAKGCEKQESAKGWRSL